MPPPCAQSTRPSCRFHDTTCAAHLRPATPSLPTKSCPTALYTYPPLTMIFGPLTPGGKGQLELVAAHRDIRLCSAAAVCVRGAAAAAPAASVRGLWAAMPGTTLLPPPAGGVQPPPVLRCGERAAAAAAAAASVGRLAISAASAAAELDWPWCGCWSWCCLWWRWVWRLLEGGRWGDGGVAFSGRPPADTSSRGEPHADGGWSLPAAAGGDAVGE